MKKVKETVQDFLSAGKEEIITGVVECDAIPEMAKEALKFAVSEGSAEVIGGVLGGVLPRVNGIRLSFQQNRFERNVNRALKEFSSQMENMNEKIANLEAGLLEKFRGLYVEWLLDSMLDEKQIEKVPMYVNGYINMMNNTTNDELMLMFFSTLGDLTELDIMVLEMYHYKGQVDIHFLIDDKHFSIEQISLIKEKLLRNGLLESKNDEQRDLNLDEVTRFVTDLAKQMKAKNPKDVKAAKIKKIPRSESYKITSLGRSYLEMTGVV